jgi:hypothetical protein
MQRLPYSACHAVRLPIWFPVGFRSASGPAGLNFYRVRLSPGLAGTEAKLEPASQRLDFSGTLRIAPDDSVRRCIVPVAANAAHLRIMRSRM